MTSNRNLFQPHLVRVLVSVAAASAGVGLLFWALAAARPARADHDHPLSIQWSSAEADASLSVAWGDYDNDGDLDLAVGNYGKPNRIYRNDKGVLTRSSFTTGLV